MFPRTAYGIDEEGASSIFLDGERDGGKICWTWKGHVHPVSCPRPTVATPRPTWRRPLALAPRQIQNIKRHKGRIPISIGGSTRGTTLAFGDWDIRIKGVGVKFTAKQQCP
ncbi:hypothetical protein EDD16DRAFT_1533507 [Pisolithus croceorrhizus]|nr:hypothetical protein EDD16DRAFT_1533507 [Pisolithus croceorrhizus]